MSKIVTTIYHHVYTLRHTFLQTTIVTSCFAFLDDEALKMGSSLNEIFRLSINGPNEEREDY